VNRDAKNLWLEALRSGQYEQGVGSLNKDDKLCCLGVLCEVAIGQGVDVSKEGEISGWISYGGETAVLPFEVAEWSGVDSCGEIPVSVGVDDDGDPYTNLADLNDNKVPFNTIADIIEEQL
jgi:hypothetical protein